MFEAVGFFSLYCLCQETRPAPILENFQRGRKKAEMDEMQKQYFEEKGNTVVQMWEGEW